MRVQHQSAADGATPLHRAAQVGNTDIATILINHGADLNAHNYLGQTPLHVALEKHFPEFAKFMIQKGARKKCKPHCMRCQTFSDSLHKNKQENNKKRKNRRRNQKHENANVGNTDNINHDDLQNHIVIE